jgi:filamentous hemagglutinin
VNLSTSGNLSVTGTEHALYGSALSLSGGTVTLSNGSSSDSLITGSTVSVTATGKNGLTLNGSILAQGDALSLSAPNGPLTVTGNIASKNNSSAGNATLTAGGDVNVTGQIDAIATINTNGAVSVTNEGGPACTSTLTVPYTDTYKAKSVSVTGNSNGSPAVYQPHIVAEGNIALTNNGTGAVCQYDLQCESKSGVITLATAGNALQKYDNSMSLTAPVIVETLAGKTQVSLDSGTSFKDAAYGGNAGSGLDLSSNTPTAATCYKAGSGYVLFTPAVTSENGTTPATVTLHNAAINNTAANSNALALPSGDVTVTLDAGTTNTLTGKNYGLYAASGSPTIGGSGTLNATGSGLYGIYAGGSLTIQDSAVITAAGKIPFYAIGNISVNGSSSITANRNNDSYPALESYNGSVTLDTTGTVSAPEIHAGTTFTRTAGTMPGSLVTECKGDSKNNAVYSVYGSYTLNQNMTVWDRSGENGLTVTDGATLTIASGNKLTVEDDTNVNGVPKITNNGTLVNNGTIDLPTAYATENKFASMTAAIKALKLTGSGTVTCGDSTYGSDGVRAVAVSDNTALDLSADPTDTTLYTFTKGGTALWTPTLDENGAVIGGTLTLNGATLGAGISASYPGGNGLRRRHGVGQHRFGVRLELSHRQLDAKPDLPRQRKADD